MSFSILQSSSFLQPAQSPVVFSVNVGSNLYTSSQFQYTCRLDYWKDNIPNPAISSSYVVLKYPNISGSGIFDFSKILNSSLRDNLIQTTSSVLAYKATFNYQYYENGWLTGSNLTSSVGLLVDGYGINPEAINADVSSRALLYPFLTDGPVSQSVMSTDSGSISVFSYNVATAVTYSGVFTNGSTQTQALTLSGGTSTRNVIKRFPIGLKEGNFPLNISGLSYYTITSNGKSIRFDVVCEPKYTPVRIGWKNRHGQIDFFNFYKASKQTFNTTQRTYQPNIGNWNNQTFSTDNYINQTQRYIVDNEQTLTVNSDFIKEEYNDIFKQLLVTDEIYWFKPNNDIVPMSIITSDMNFKTGVNDKLIQYSFVFNIGRNYKQIV